MEYFLNHVYFNSFELTEVFKILSISVTLYNIQFINMY